MTDDHGARDASILRNSYTTVLRRAAVPHERFAAYWRDVHGPLCSRIDGLGWYVQHHFARAQDAHLWPRVADVGPLPGYTLDGAVEIGFLGDEQQRRFQDASPILFSDEQNVFEETIAYDLPDGSVTVVDRQPDPVPNGPDRFDRVHVHLSVRPGEESRVGQLLREDLGPQLAARSGTVKVRLHTPPRRDDDESLPPAPNVAHALTDPRRSLAIMELAFSDPRTRRSILADEALQPTLRELAGLLTHATPFAVTGVFTMVRDEALTTAGLRGSRVAELIDALAATNQTSPEVADLMRRGSRP